MAELIRDLIVLGIICACPVAFIAGRLVENRSWERQRAALCRVITSQAVRGTSDAQVIDDQAAVIRDQRALLVELVDAAELVATDRPGWNPGQLRLVSIAAKARKELL
jgi:hypothetical protein